MLPNNFFFIISLKKSKNKNKNVTKHPLTFWKVGKPLQCPSHSPPYELFWVKSSAHEFMNLLSRILYVRPTPIFTITSQNTILQYQRLGTCNACDIQRLTQLHKTLLICYLVEYFWFLYLVSCDFSFSVWKLLEHFLFVIYGKRMKVESVVGIRGLLQLVLQCFFNFFCQNYRNFID